MVLKNLLLSTYHSPPRKSDFSTPVAGLHLLKNLLLSSYHSPPRKSDFSTPVAGLHLFKNLLLSTYHLFSDIVWPAYTSFGQGQNFVQKDWVNGIFSLGPDEEGIGSTISLCIIFCHLLNIHFNRWSIYGFLNWFLCDFNLTNVTFVIEFMIQLLT